MHRKICLLNYMKDFGAYNGQDAFTSLYLHYYICSKPCMYNALCNIQYYAPASYLSNDLPIFVLCNNLYCSHVYYLNTSLPLQYKIEVKTKSFPCKIE